MERYTFVMSNLFHWYACLPLCQYNTSLITVDMMTYTVRLKKNKPLFLASIF